MGYKKGKKELGIYYAKTLVSIAEEISAKNAGKEKAGIQKIFSVLQRSGGIIRKNMTYLVTHWIYRLSLFTPFWLELVTMDKEKQQILPEFLLEWLWVECEKEQTMEKIRYWASSYCLPFV